MIENGLCQCGCGRKTNISKQNRVARGWKKDEPMRFIFGHNNRLRKHLKERYDAYGYKLTYAPSNPRCHEKGMFFEHIVVAERALGKHIPKGVEVHHFPSKENCTHLVICQDHRYHKLLHIHYRALLACGNPNWRKCAFCKKYDDIKNLYCFPNGYGHKHQSCSNAYQREYRKKLESTLPPLNLITENSQ